MDHFIHLVPIDEVLNTPFAEVEHIPLTYHQQEAERLESQHRVFNIIFDDRRVFPPMTEMKAVLDCGYGAASWAIDVAEAYPDCEVVLPHQTENTC